MGGPVGQGCSLWSAQTQEGISEEGPFMEETGSHPGTSPHRPYREQSAPCLLFSWSLGWYQGALWAGSTSHCSEGTDQRCSQERGVAERRKEPGRPLPAPHGSFVPVKVSWTPVLL